MIPEILKKSKYAPRFALIYGFIVFCLAFIGGYKTGNISNKPPLSTTIPNQLINNLPILISTILTMVVSLPFLKIFQDISESEGEEQVKKLQKEYIPKITELLQILEVGKIEEDTKNKSIKILEELRDITQIGKRKVKAGKNVADFLKNSRNLDNLVDTIFNVPEVNNLIPKGCHKLFKNDIHHCLRWLQCSLENKKSCKFYIKKLASGNRSNMPDIITPYTYTKALQEVQKELEAYSEQTGVVQDYINELEKYLQQNLQHNK